MKGAPSPEKTLSLMSSPSIAPLRALVNHTWRCRRRRRYRVLVAMRVEPRPPSKLGNKGKRRCGVTARKHGKKTGAGVLPNYRPVLLKKRETGARDEDLGFRREICCKLRAICWCTPTLSLSCYPDLVCYELDSLS